MGFTTANLFQMAQIRNENFYFINFFENLHYGINKTSYSHWHEVDRVLEHQQLSLLLPQRAKKLQKPS